MDFELTVLGTGAALPAKGRFPTSQLLRMGGKRFLIDCGEGTQERLRAGGHNLQQIDHILISHMHGDHYLGLMGLISSMHLLGRKKELTIHGPKLLEEIIDIQLRASKTYLRYTLHFNWVDHESGVVLFEDECRRITSIALKHRVPCTGFRFDETTRKRKLNRAKLNLIPHYKRTEVQAGKDLHLADGTVILNKELTLGEPHLRSYAYCSDTAYHEPILDTIRGVDLLYHESTFTEQLKERAKETEHSTAKEAALIAKQANAGCLLLGHFSSRYKDLTLLQVEAQKVFDNTLLSMEGTTYQLHEHGIIEK